MIQYKSGRTGVYPFAKKIRKRSAARFNCHLRKLLRRSNPYRQGEGGEQLQCPRCEIAITAASCKLKGRQRAFAADK